MRKIIAAAFMSWIVPSIVIQAVAAPPAPGGRKYDLKGLHGQLDDYLEKYHDPSYTFNKNDLRGHFSYQPGESEDLYGSADMVYVLYTVGELDTRTTRQGRREWIYTLQSFQNPETGWFDIANETLHFKSHATAYATGALKLLGAAPRYPFRWADDIESREDMERWLEGIWWDYVWIGSHEGGGVAAALAMAGGVPDEWFDNYLGWLDREVNPETGLWQRAFYNVLIKKPRRTDLGGAAHFWWIYQYRRKPIPYPEKVIDTCLSLQRESGFWDKPGKRKGDVPYGINLDAINGISAAYFQLLDRGVEYRRDDIIEAFDRFLQSACAVLDAPGSLDRLYSDSHRMPGGLVGIAEANDFFIRVTGISRIEDPLAWNSIFDEICWM